MAVSIMTRSGTSVQDW